MKKTYIAPVSESMTTTPSQMLAASISDNNLNSVPLNDENEYAGNEQLIKGYKFFWTEE